MIRLPILESLGVDGYGMFPGSDTKPGLHVVFKPGLTLILGANGLGKSTLVTLLYRMCTGPYDIPGLATPGALGFARLEATKLQRWNQRILASRVVDEAKDAHATLALTLGTSRIEVTRALDSLAVTALRCDGEELQATDDRFQRLIGDSSGLSTFGDWILLLHYLTFYFEDRRALVWDKTAQRQVLRLLMLPKVTAARWASKEREALELDSRVRNLQATLNREESAERRARAKVMGSKAISAEIDVLESDLLDLVPRLEELSASLPEVDAERQRARLRALTAEQERDSAYRGLERLQLTRIADAFPSHTETARYLISRLLSTEVCQTCGSEVPEFAAELESRLLLSRCVICSSEIPDRRKASRALQRELEARTSELERLESALVIATRTRDDAESDFESRVIEFRNAENEVIQRRARIAALVRRLPADERSLRGQTAEVMSLRGRLEGLRQDLNALRQDFEDLVKTDMLTIAENKTVVIDAFQTFAEGFLFESCKLKWAPHKDRVGQTGPTVDYPAFEFEMSGSDFPSPVRRSGPDQVSESQREFIDLAFRMTLMKVASDNGSGSLVIDAPESSLDAVFSERAAKVLARFGAPTGNNRLLVTSNLVEGNLIPQLLREAKIASPRSSRVVDLLRIATPTTAIRVLAADYSRVRDEIFAAAKETA